MILLIINLYIYKYNIKMFILIIILIKKELNINTLMKFNLLLNYYFINI